MTGATISGANPGGVIPVNIASDVTGSVTLNLSGNQYQNGSIFYYYGTLEPTLQAWQSASGQDLGMGTTFIAAQPESQTIANGSTAVFTVAASGPAQMASLAGYGEQSVALFSGTTYQWQFDGNALADGNGVSGSTGPQLMIQGASASDDGDYACLVTSGGDSMLSNPANLLVGEISNPGTLVNMSARGWVGTGDNVLIGGFYIVGSTSRTVLIQALGPALSGDGVSGTLQRPVLTIHNSSGATIYSNSGWGSNEILLEAAAAAYADPVLQPHSADSELLLTLPPGGYTAEIAGADGGSGVALCATYQLP